MPDISKQDSIPVLKDGIHRFASCFLASMSFTRAIVRHFSTNSISHFNFYFLIIAYERLAEGEIELFNPVGVSEALK